MYKILHQLDNTWINDSTWCQEFVHAQHVSVREIPTSSCSARFRSAAFRGFPQDIGEEDRLLSRLEEEMQVYTPAPWQVTCRPVSPKLAFELTFGFVGGTDVSMFGVAIFGTSDFWFEQSSGCMWWARFQSWFWVFPFERSLGG